MCYSHCKFLARLIKSVAPNQSPGYSHLCLLLQRLIPLMAESSKVGQWQEAAGSGYILISGEVLNILVNILHTHANFKLQRKPKFEDMNYS